MSGQLRGNLGAASLAIGAALMIAGCNTGPAGEGEGGDECKGRLAGDLVITEFMNDPEGTDTGKEYLEIYNATEDAVSLKGLTLYAAKVDGSRAKTHVIARGDLAPGAYLVLGDVADDKRPEHVDYGFGDALGGLNNSEGLVGVRCGDTVVDEVKYTQAGESGHAMTLDGNGTPDSAGNDNADNWCVAVGEFEPGAYGTPGERNAPCGTSGGCMDPVTGNNRPPVVPNPGDLVISEFMANPAAVDDTAGEWLEVFVRADVDLNDLALSNGGATRTPLTSTTCLRVTAGSYVVFAKKLEAALNGGLPAPLATFGFSLTNSTGTLAILNGESVIDQVSYATSGNGVSTQVDPSKLDATSNDDGRNWCPATQGYGAAADKGTPGAANTTCPPIVDPDACTDTTTNSSRKPVAPVAGDLVITEFMADSSKVDDAVGEWFEVYVKNDVDLNGLELANDGTGKTVLNSAECIHPGAGTYVVFARSADSAANGGLPSVLKPFSFSLVNSGAHGLVLRHKGVELDRITYSASTPGASTQLDAAKTDATLNDDVANFCVTPAATTYGLGDRGTPGAVNGACQ